MILQVDLYLLVPQDVYLQFHYKKDSNLFQPHLYLYSLFQGMFFYLILPHNHISCSNIHCFYFQYL